jgi:hypothetical protein
MVLIMNKDEFRKSFNDSVVSKDKRARAYALARTIKDPERRCAALVFVRGSTRTESQIDAFIKRMKEAE